MADTGPKTVLVIDDDRDLLDLVTFLLEDEGYRVETALDGLERLRKVEQKKPDLILLDMKMPAMNGWEFAREFHARYDRQVPIVVLTAAENARKRAEEIGAQGWVGKPFNLDTLVQAGKRHIRR